MKSVFAESTVLDLHREWHDYTTYRNEVSAPPRITISLRGSADPVEIRRHAAIVRMVSAVESYVDGINRNYILRVNTQSGGEIENTLTRLEELLTSNWESRRLALTEFYSLDFGDAPEWARFRGIIEARNIIVHHLGSLADARRNVRTQEARLKQVGFAISGGLLVVSDEVLSTVFEACSTFVRWIDEHT